MTAARIRSLFLQPKPTYSIAEAAELLGMSWRDVRGWLEVGELEGVETAHGLALPWGELVSFGIDFWSQEVVEEALGAELAEAIPELLQLADLEVRIPRLEVVALERVAAQEKTSVDALFGARAARLRLGPLGVAVGRDTGVRGGNGVAAFASLTGAADQADRGHSQPCRGHSQPRRGHS